ncbi:MAG: FAD-dependent monooxygenase [Nannocystis sp.]|nr:FAD-dependent monooxygenase [Nannocystis sp.]
MGEQRYDVVIVGGRPGGASLAARLGAAGVRTLVVERARFPSAPAVSAPFLMPHAMALLDEIGADEAEYAAETPRLRSFVLELAGYFRSKLDFESELAGRSYYYTIDRAQLDTAIWRGLSRFASVEAWSEAKVCGLLREGDAVRGVVVERGDGARVEISAGAVIGADGRFSTVAKQVDARVTERREDVETTVYYGVWEGVADYEGPEPLAQIHSGCDGFAFVFMPTARGQTLVLAQGRADAFAALEGDPAAIYEGLLRARPRVWWRLAGARRVGALAGMKRVGNLFHEAGGDGWALVGDAYHQKDSIDAQGIYDALLGAKLLAASIVRWRAGAIDWQGAVKEYEAGIYAACKPMFDSTMGRLAREIYQVPPPMAAKTVMRWMLTHPDYGRRYSALVTRQIEPARFLAPPVMLTMIAKGAAQRLGRRLRGVDPSDPLPLRSV